MSAVRMCDQCGTIFPEGEEGSAVGQMTVNRRDANGIVRPMSAAKDMCKGCAGGDMPKPRLSIEGATVGKGSTVVDD